jgi:hypothetical protein
MVAAFEHQMTGTEGAPPPSFAAVPSGRSAFDSDSDDLEDDSSGGVACEATAGTANGGALAGSAAMDVGAGGGGAGGPGGGGHGTVTATSTVTVTAGAATQGTSLSVQGTAALGV